MGSAMAWESVGSKLEAWGSVIRVCEVTEREVWSLIGL